MNARIENGWIVVDCDAPDTQPVYLALRQPDQWRPAYRDWSGGIRTAKIRPYGSGRSTVYVRVGDTITTAGRVIF